MLLDKKVLEVTGNKLKRKKQSIAVAESVTSGLLQYAFSQITDAREIFQGGITTYNLGQKSSQLGVEPIHAEACNCVSLQVAGQMAQQVQKKFNSDWGIGITGYATPVPESGKKLFCYYCITFRGKVKSEGKIKLTKMSATAVQMNYVNRVLKKISTLI